MAKEPEYKKRCRKCMYSTMMHTGRNASVIACYYNGKTQQRRGCPASECDKFEPKIRGQKNGKNQN